MDSQTLKDSIETRLKAQIDIIEQALIDINHGDVGDLEGLDDEVESICDDIKKLPHDIAQSTEPLMLEMIGKLEKLAVVLQEHQDDLKGRMS